MTSTLSPEHRLRVLIADDEAPARSRLARFLAELPDVELVGQAASGREAIELARREQPDLLFLDIQMPGLDGFDVLAELQPPPLVVFVTAHEAYAVKAFDVGSCDYILKPYPRERVAQAIERARERLAAAEAPDWRALIGALAARPGPPARPLRVAVRDGQKIRLLAPEEILLAASEDRLVRIYTAAGRFMTDETLAQLEERLGPDFFRCHRAVLVNLRHVVEIQPWFAGAYRIVLDRPNLPKLPLSRRRARDLREFIPF